MGCVSVEGRSSERLPLADAFHDEVHAVRIPANLHGAAVIAVHHVQGLLERVIVRLHVCCWHCNLADNLAVRSGVFHDYSFFLLANPCSKAVRLSWQGLQQLRKFAKS